MQPLNNEPETTGDKNLPDTFESVPTGITKKPRKGFKASAEREPSTPPNWVEKKVQEHEEAIEEQKKKEDKKLAEVIEERSAALYETLIGDTLGTDELDTVTGAADMSLWTRTFKLRGHDRWYMKHPDGEWVLLHGRNSMRQWLTKGNVFKHKLDADFYTAMDMPDRQIDGELSHPFFKTGMVNFGPRKVFNYNKVQPVTPVTSAEFDMSLIEKEITYIKNLGNNDPEQYERLFDMQRAIYTRCNDLSGVGRNLPALFLLGLHNLGKTLLTLMTQALLGGGETGNAKMWLFGKDNFTADLFSNPILVADDAEFLAVKGSAGFARGQIKALVAESAPVWRGMFAEGKSYPWGGLFVFIGNVQNLRGMFDTQEDFSGKVIMIECGDGMADGYAAHIKRMRDLHSDVQTYYATIAAHYARWLLDRKPVYTEGRFPVTPFVHENFRRNFGASNEASTALDLIEVYFEHFGDSAEKMDRLTARGIYADLMNNPQTVKLLAGTSLSQFRVMLDGLSDKGHADRCLRYTSGKNVYYRITRGELSVPAAAPVSPVVAAEVKATESKAQVEADTKARNEAMRDTPENIARVEQIRSMPMIDTDPEPEKSNLEEWGKWRLRQLEKTDRVTPAARFNNRKSGGAN